MPRKSVFLGSIALLVAALLPSTGASAAGDDPIPPDNDRMVDLTKVVTGQPKTFKNVEPDRVINQANGTRIEIYTSVGDTEAGLDWRSVNEFSYLVNSVPKNKKSYTTLFNSLYDGQAVGYDSTNNKFTVAPDSAGKPLAFAPTAAYLNQANLYTTEAERKTYINILGAKESMGEAFDNNSSLARLVKSKSPAAANYRECNKGSGACLTNNDGENLMHAKYGAFEQAADSDGNIRDNVVFVTSSNLNGSSGGRKSNTSIAVFNDKKAYDALSQDVFGSEINGANNPKGSVEDVATDGYKKAITEDPATGLIPGLPSDSGVTFFPSPRAFYKVSGNDVRTKRADVEAGYLLNQRDNGQTDKTGCKLYTAHSLFNSSRQGVEDGLVGLSKQGCDVRIVLGTNAISDIVDGYFSMSSDLRQMIDRVEFANVHDKTISYRYGNEAATFGGSANFSGTSLDYDELAYKTQSTDVADTVQTHLDRIYQRAKGMTKYKLPTSASIAPSSSSAKPAKVGLGRTLQLATRVLPENALVTKTEWASSNPSAVSVDQTGKVTGLTPGATAEITATVSTPDPKSAKVSSPAYVQVSGDGSTDSGAKTEVTNPPVLSMERYQSPNGTTPIQITWGSGDKDYSGVVKLQYYSSGWKTYPTAVNVDKGIGRISPSFSSSKTWRAYGARVDGIYDKNGTKVADGDTNGAMSAWSIVTVRTKTTTSTPRIYATNLAKFGQTVPFLVSWDRPGGTYRLQMRTSGGSWKTHSTYKLPSGSNQDLIGIPIGTTKYWRIATSTGTTKTSSAVKVVIQQ